MNLFGSGNVKLPPLEVKREVIPMKKKCEICGKIIPKERLEALPETKRCVQCAKEKGPDVHAKRTEVGMDIDTYKDLLGAMRS